MRKSCRYCNNSFDDGKRSRTKEHVFPRGILDLYPNQEISFFNDKVFVDKQGITINDVCSHCNNELLSILDGYGKELIRKQFTTPVPFGEIDSPHIKELDYYKLTRWLLKIHYNNQIATKDNTEWHEAALGYILHGVLVENINFSIFVGIHISIAPMPERIFGYMPIQLHKEPKLLKCSLLRGALGQDLSLFEFNVKSAKNTFCIRLGEAIFYGVLWGKDTPPEKRYFYERLFQKEFNFIKISSDRDLYNLRRVSANTNVIMGYSHLISSDGLEEDLNMVRKSIGGKRPDEVQFGFDESMMDSGQAFIEHIMFPKNKKFKDRYEKLCK